MDVPEQQPDPDGGDAPGHEPEGSSQDEFDFSILFDYDYLNPIEGPWRLPPGLASKPGLGLGPGEWAQGPLPLHLTAGLGGWKVPLPR